ncbi:single-stranded DNA-binding protein, partial [bacterium M00.F.Ca.ET.194.01.1.1]
YVEGQVQTRKWQDQTGNDRYTTEVVLQKFRGELQMLDARGEGGGQVGSYAGGGNSSRGSDFGQSGPNDSFSRGGVGGGSRGGGGCVSRELDDEIPF